MFMVLLDSNESRPLLKYTTVQGLFFQDDPDTDPATFDYTATNLGLINQTYNCDTAGDGNHTKTQWQRFKGHIARLNEMSDSHVQYKLLYLGRHGEGIHNVAQAHYGTAAWDNHWSKFEGNGTVIWADAHLTDKGIHQAQIANSFWAKAIEVQKIPVPERYYTSPLHRCLATANVTFSSLQLPVSQPFVPEVKELLREVNGVPTCDRRSSKTYIESEFLLYHIEEGFAENDHFWSPEVRESDSDIDARLKKLLDDVFVNDPSTYISFTSHSGAISGLLRVLGHRPFRLSTGSVIPVFVKAETHKVNENTSLRFREGEYTSPSYQNVQKSLSMNFCWARCRQYRTYATVNTAKYRSSHELINLITIGRVFNIRHRVRKSWRSIEFEITL